MLRLAVAAAIVLLVSACGSSMMPGSSADMVALPDLTVLPDLVPDKPAAPTSLKVTPLMGGAHITWKDNSSDEDGFMIMNKEPGGMYKEVATVPFNTTVFHNAPLPTGKTYTYQVHAVKGDVSSDPSNEVTITVL